MMISVTNLNGVNYKESRNLDAATNEMTLHIGSTGFTESSNSRVLLISGLLMVITLAFFIF